MQTWRRRWFWKHLANCHSRSLTVTVNFAPNQEQIHTYVNKLHHFFHQLFHSNYLTLFYQQGSERRALCSVLLTKYYSGNQIKNNQMSRVCSTYGDRNVSYKVSVGKPEGRRPLRRPRRRWEDNIKMGLQEVG